MYAGIGIFKALKRHLIGHSLYNYIYLYSFNIGGK